MREIFYKYKNNIDITIVIHVKLIYNCRYEEVRLCLMRERDLHQ